MNLDIEKLDYEGKGLAHINGKVCFVPRTLPKEKVQVRIIQENKNYLNAEIDNIYQYSKERISSFCPYGELCGGCTYDIVGYETSLMYKKSIVEELFARKNISIANLQIIGSKLHLAYRNKISLKVQNNCFGYYKKETHQFVPIQNCLLAKASIQAFLKDFEAINLQNGTITIRSNYNDELLIAIESDNPPLILEKLTEKHKIAGIIWNKKCIYNNSYFIEQRDDILYKVHMDAFFQVNEDIAENIGNYILPFFENTDEVLDLYCGVGYFSLKLAKKVKKVIGIEENPKAIIDAKYNATLNNFSNISFHVGKVEDILKNIPNKANKILLDPPRSGLHKNVTKALLDNSYDTICYVSCNARTLIRDLERLQDKYKIITVKLFDMFPMTNHVECVCVLNSKR